MKTHNIRHSKPMFNKDLSAQSEEISWDNDKERCVVYNQMIRKFSSGR